MSLNREVAAEAARAVAEYIRQRDIAMSGGNVGDVIATIYTDTTRDPADLDVNDLRALVAPYANPRRFDVTRDQLAQAVFDPGAIVGRRLGPSWGQGQPGYSEEQESLWDWHLRAVLRVTGHNPPAPGEHTDPPAVEVIGEDLALIVSPHGATLSALTYEQLLTFQERVEDAVKTMALMPSTTPSTVQRPRKERRDGNTHEGPAA